MQVDVHLYCQQRQAAIAQNLRLAREKAGWTQGQVAAFLRYSRAHINRVEQCRAQLSIAELELLARAFGVTLGSLLAQRELSSPA